MLVFVHIPKVAGTTLFHVLKCVSGNEYALHAGKSEETRALFRMTTEEAQQYKVISAHATYPNLAKLCGPKAEYITLVREPIDRFISLYHFIASQKWHPLHNIVKEKSLDEFADFCMQDQKQRDVFSQSRFICGQYDGKLAVDYLRKRYLLAAPLEQFDRFLWRLFARKKWVPFEYKSKNRSLDRPAVEAISPKCVEKISALFSEDMIPYQYLCENDPY
jgi:Sulfotransferase family